MLAKLLQKHFYEVQIGLGVLFLAMAYFLFGRKDPNASNFRVREDELRKAKGAAGIKDAKGAPDALANAKIEPKERLALPGISLAGEPHEILGVPHGATSAQIQRAYRELMKRYHPDKIGPQGSREWNDAQKIAHALNEAKDKMLSRAKGSLKNNEP